MDAIKPLCLIDKNLRIQTFTDSDVDRLAQAIYSPTSWFEKTCGLKDWTDYAAQLRRTLEEHRNQLAHPIAYWLNGEVAGVTSFHRLDKRGRFLEIGRTNIAPSLRRTDLNTKTKLHLMTYAFEELGANRVEFRVNVKNYNSQLAMLRLGVRHEGTLAESCQYTNHSSDSHLYAVTKSSWPTVKAHIQALQSGKNAILFDLAKEFNFEATQLRMCKFGDGQQLFDFVQRNKECLERDFPKLHSINGLPEALRYISENAHETAKEKSIHFGCFGADANLLIGQFAIKNIDRSVGSCELGYVLDKEYRKKGLSTLAINEILKRLKMAKVQRVFVRICPENLASLQLAQKVGFTKEGILKQAFKTGDGRLVDCIQLSKLI